MYLDEQSTALPGRNLDIYAADMERIEVLEGPQGTLFGSGAQAGVLRYITNKPKLDTTEGDVNAGYSYTAGGDPNSNVDAMINMPLIPDTLAFRAVIYNDSRGGYINNVPATFTRAQHAMRASAAQGGVVPTNSVSINNNNLVANAINPVTYTGIRASLLWKDQRRLGRAADAELSEHERAGRVLSRCPTGPKGLPSTAWASRYGVRAAAAPLGDAVQPVLQQG